MSVNQHLPHVLVLPEDDANRQIANGFHRHIDWDRLRKLQVLRPAGGWGNVLDLFRSEHIAAMDNCPMRLMVLLLDFDENADRLARANAVIPERLKERVFVLGAWSEPEQLKSALGQNFETLGSNMADDCRDQTQVTWGHELLKHNENELKRLRQSVVPVLFAAE